METIQRSYSITSQSDSERLELFFSCRNLKDMDTVTVTDSFLVVRLTEPGQSAKQVLRTKTVENSLNPDYFQTAVINYEFEVRQILTFEVYHDGRSPVLVGAAEASVGQIFGSRQKRIIRDLRDRQGKTSGKIIVRCDVVPRKDLKVVDFDVWATRLPDMTYFYFFGGNNPFFRIQKRRQNQTYLVYQSQVAHNTRNPRWKKVNITERKLCDNNGEMEIICQVLNYSQRGNHDLLGQFRFTLDQLLDKNTFPLTKGNSPVQNSLVMFNNIKRIRKYDFMEFVNVGLQMQLVGCVDFTGSNGVPTRQQSLHFTGSSRRTAYEEALRPVGQILLDYDADKLVPMYGFGAKVRMPTFNTQGAVHHCFPLNGVVHNPEVYLIEGILATYRSCISYLEFSGPTVFTPLLREAMTKAKAIKQAGNQYMILMILTDGEIHDMVDTCHELVQCSRLPMSVIIVGIGNGDFKLMEQLDDDDMQMVDRNGRKTERDLVQFVPFREYNNDGVALAKHVLQELPRQVVEYHELCKITPQMIPKPVAQNDISLQKMIYS